VPLIALAAITILVIAISIFCLSSGYFIIFQNLFYIPIIIACVYYTKRGFAFSVIIACIYFFLVIVFTSESAALLEALIRVGIFVLIAGIINFLSSVRKRSEEMIRRLNEDLKRRNLELEAINKELEAFSYSVSHDLRAPLRGIDGFSRALLEDYGDKLDQQGKDHLRRVRFASQRMGEIIEGMLNLARVTRTPLHQQVIDFSVRARSIAEQLQEKQPKRQVEFVIGEGVTGNGDRRLLEIVLENLLSNAWKFTEKHPRARIEFGVAQKQGETVYFVRDDGAGFDMAYVDKLFGAFQRLHTKDEFEGTGIGLATVQRIIHRHGGRIWAEGETGKGATFYFTLPKVSAPQVTETLNQGGRHAEELCLVSGRQQ
jgi:light-regulated signal transduction histidine kinase (bacteriophytochrome)